MREKSDLMFDLDVIPAGEDAAARTARLAKKEAEARAHHQRLVDDARTEWETDTARRRNEGLMAGGVGVLLLAFGSLLISLRYPKA